VGDAAGGGAADLLIRLRRWRDRQARASRVLPDAVLPDDVLAAVAEAAPDSLDRLATVPGVGPVRARLLGPGLLAALGET
jgi:DNA helicase-2/ATP-dependent DNA helicase PcrA